MLLASSVNTHIDNNRSHLLAFRVRGLCELGLNPNLLNRTACLSDTAMSVVIVVITVDSASPPANTQFAKLSLTHVFICTASTLICALVTRG